MVFPSDDRADIDAAIDRLTAMLLRRQSPDGSWRYCFENGITIDTYVIIVFRTLGSEDETLIRGLHDRIVAAQQPEGCWKLYRDEAGGNLSASVDAYYALLYSGYSRRTDPHMEQASRYIRAKGGLGRASSILTKAVLAATGQSRWPLAISSIPLEILLLPSSFPISFFDFSGYSRVHLVPMLLMADRNFSIRTADTPDLSDLRLNRPEDEGEEEQYRSPAYRSMLERIYAGLSKLAGAPGALHESARTRAELFMLERIESDGTLYSYASCTVLMLLALLSLGYDKRHPVIVRAVEGLTGMSCRSPGQITIQNSPPTIWDTALLAYALQETGTAADHAAIRRAAAYLLARQHHRTGDWSLHNPDAVPGGWGFSESNTINPDVDDTTAALRAIGELSRTDAAYREAWNRGLQWVLSMQNKDGGWPAFEKNIDNPMLTWLAIDGAKSAAIDPSEADLTGRTLEYLGNFAGLDTRHDYVKRGVNWLVDHQEKDGSWYGRWGICYIYGTWAALTGLAAVGVPSNHQSVRKGAEWLLESQNGDGGWGESCGSDRQMRYVPLGESTPSQTAWALDALIAVMPEPTAAINNGITRLIDFLDEDGWRVSYPTGAGLPGHFYSDYHSYRYIWPLLALGHYRNKYAKA